MISRLGFALFLSGLLILLGEHLKPSGGGAVLAGAFTMFVGLMTYVLSSPKSS